MKSSKKPNDFNFYLKNYMGFVTKIIAFAIVIKIIILS